MEAVTGPPEPDPRQTGADARVRQAEGESDAAQDLVILFHPDFYRRLRPVRSKERIT